MDAPVGGDEGMTEGRGRPDYELDEILEVRRPDQCITVMVWNVITVSFRQAVVPAGIFGRVNSVYRLLGWGGMSVGALLGGLLARSFVLTTPFWVGAGVLLAMNVVTLPLVNNRTVAEARADHPAPRTP